jgi:hypothetical protein
MLQSALFRTFLYLRTGKLFRFDTLTGKAELDWDAPRPTKKIEFFWLCEACVSEFTLVNDTKIGARVVPLQARTRAGNGRFITSQGM